MRCASTAGISVGPVARTVRAAGTQTERGRTHSLRECSALRTPERRVRVAVINVFPAPVDDEWNQPLPPPKLASDALVRAVVAALRDGIEDVYPGDVAQEWLARWRENPKAGTVEIPGRGGTNSMCDLSFVGKHTRHF